MTFDVGVVAACGVVAVAHGVNVFWRYPANRTARTTSLGMCLLSLALAVAFAADLGGDGRSSAARVALVVLLVPAYALFAWRGWMLWTARRQARRAGAGVDAGVDAGAEVS